MFFFVIDRLNGQVVSYTPPT